MQTRFAVVTLYNTETTIRARYLVACLKKRWSALFIEAGARTSSGSTVTLRDSAAREPRIAELRYNSGFVNNEAKCLTEIAMLIRRHVQPPRAGYYDDASDWKVEENKEYTFREITTATVVSTALVGLVLRRLFSAADEEYGQRAAAVMSNRSNRLTENSPDGYHGLLCMTPGAWWRGSYYDTVYGREAFNQLRVHHANIGRLLAQCIRMSRLGENFEGLYNELLQALTASDNSTMEFSPPQRGRLLTALNKINNNTIMLGDCGHFAEAGYLLAVGPGHRVRMWCRHCYENTAVLVIDRSERWQAGYAHWSDRHQAYYSYDIDGAEGHGRERPIRAIMEYTTNVTRLLASDAAIRSSHYGDFLMGLELEMTSGNADPTVAAKDVRRRLGPDYCIVKSDGSLPTNGFEIVTAPRGLAEHVRRIEGWEINAAYRAWDTNQCGLHVHIHSRAFTEMTVGKFLMFLNADFNATFLRKLAGRHPNKDTWAARYCAAESQEVLENPKMAVKGKSPERYRIVNLQNLSRSEAERLGLPSIHLNGKYDTLEVRVFKASLRKERLLAQVEFAHAAVMFCRVASYRDLTGKAFLQWLAPRSKLYPHLANWYGTRKSKAIKDAGGKPLEETCADKSPPGEVPVAPRRPRLAGRLPSGLNDAVLPPVPRTRVRRRPGEDELSYIVRVQRERERQAEERQNPLRRSPTSYRVNTI